jgi:hypothetical protein
MENTTRNTETRLCLKAGEMRLQHGLAGTLIVVDSGSVWQESAPRWLGEEMHVTRQRLDAGSCLRVEETGWTRLTAERDCALTWIALADEPGLLALLLTRLRGRHVRENRRLAEEVKRLRMLLENRENCR